MPAPKVRDVGGGSSLPVTLHDAFGNPMLPGGALFAAVSRPLAGTGDQVVVAAVPGAQIYVFSYKLVTDVAQIIGFRDGIGGTFIDGPYQPGANGGVVDWVLPPAFLFFTSVGNALVLNVASVNIGGGIRYFLK